MSDTTPTTTADLLTRIDRAWDSLEATIGQLDDSELADRRDAAGWAVKDHLMHVAAWEQAFLGRLQGRPLHEGLGLDAATAGQDEDAVNAAIFTRHRHRPLAEVLETLRTTHAATRARLATLSDRDLAGTRARLTPGAGGDEEAVLPWIAGNTWEHYDQHHGWIRTLVGRA